METQIEKYRFTAGSLYEYDESTGSYIHCFKQGNCNTKSKAIKEYESQCLAEELN